MKTHYETIPLCDCKQTADCCETVNVEFDG